MKLRHIGGDDKVELQMTAMIDVVFQLLVFFLFSFKIMPTEGEFAVYMPARTSGSAAQADKIDLTEKILIRLEGGGDGRLVNILLGENQLGPRPSVLAQQLRDAFVGPQGTAEDLEVEINADPRLQYYYLIRTTNAVMSAGIRKINLADRPPRR